MRRLLLIVLGALLLPGEVRAADLRLTFRMHPATAAVTGAASVHVTQGDHQTARTARVAAEGGLIAGLEPGLWQVTAELPGYFAVPGSVLLTEDVAVLVVDVYRTATVTGTLQMSSGSKVPRQLEAEVRPSPADPPQDLPKAVVACDLRDSTFSCVVPAGLLDVRLSAEGFVPLYKWALAAPPSGTAALGKLTLQRGSSVTGRVLNGDRRPLSASKIQVKVSRDASLPAVLKERIELADTMSHPNERGLFSFALSPGDYVVQAVAPGLISDARTIHVVDGKEAELREPLMLKPPRQLTIHASPPLAPGGKPWHVSLTKHDLSGVTEASITDVMPASGEWKRGGLVPGHYAVSLGRISEDSWFQQEIDIDADTSVDANVRFVRVAGQISLAGKPLEAHLRFTEAAEGREILLRSHPDGTFPSMLPETSDGKWNVQITSEKPYVHRSVTITAAPEPPSSIAHVSIELPGTMLAGVIVDQEGHVEPRGLVDVQFSDGTKSQIEVEDGTFALNGVAPGTLIFQAHTRTASTRKPLAIDVADSNDVQDVRLEVAPTSLFEGIVQTLEGPVSEAIASPLPLDPRGGVVARLGVEADGHFRVPVAPGSSEFFLLVAAPGYAARVLRPAVQSDPPVPILLSTLGGTLVLNASNSKDYVPYLVHDQAMFPAMPIVWVAGGSRAESNGVRSRTIDLVEPGSYALCWYRDDEVAAAAAQRSPVSADRCTSGFLAPHATLTLEMKPAPGSYAVRTIRGQIVTVDILTLRGGPGMSDGSATFTSELRLRLSEVSAILMLLRFQAMIHAPNIALRMKVVRTLDDIHVEIGDLIQFCGSDHSVELPLRKGHH
jgi:hypothetical protein